MSVQHCNFSNKISEAKFKGCCEAQNKNIGLLTACLAATDRTSIVAYADGPLRENVFVLIEQYAARAVRRALTEERSRFHQIIQREFPLSEDGSDRKIVSLALRRVRS